MDSLRMVGTLSLTANGVYLENTTNLSIDNSVISVAESYGMYAQNANISSITSSTIDGTYSEAAIKMESCIGCVVNNNTISSNRYRGIWMNQGFNTIITNNIMDVDYYGIEANDGSYYTLNGNIITINNINNNSSSRGVDFYSSEFCVVTIIILPLQIIVIILLAFLNWGIIVAIVNGNTIDATLWDSTQCNFYYNNGSSYNTYNVNGVNLEMLKRLIPIQY